MAWLFLLAAHAVAFGAWLAFTRYEVRENDADITANGSQDSLRRAYHLHRTLVRGAVLAGLVLAASLPVARAGILAYLLSTSAMIVLLTGYFCRFFTPLLNLARRVGGRADLSEWYNSLDSASWPDAACAKKVRRLYPTYSTEQLLPLVASELRHLLTRLWWATLVAYALLLAAAFWTA